MVLTGRRHVPRQGGDPLQPGTHRREALQVVTTLRTEARVHIEGDVRNRGAIPSEKIRARQDAAPSPREPCSPARRVAQARSFFGSSSRRPTFATGGGRGG